MQKEWFEICGFDEILVRNGEEQDEKRMRKEYRDLRERKENLGLNLTNAVRI